MKKFFFLPLVALLFLAVKCPLQNTPPKQNPPDVLPPATQTGANTMGFLLNGKVWLPFGKPGKPSLNAQYFKGLFTLSAERKVGTNGESVFQTLSCSYKPIYGVGTYYFKYAPVVIWQASVT